MVPVTQTAIAATVDDVDDVLSLAHATLCMYISSTKYLRKLNLERLLFVGDPVPRQPLYCVVEVERGGLGTRTVVRVTDLPGTKTCT